MKNSEYLKLKFETEELIARMTRATYCWENLVKQIGLKKAKALAFPKTPKPEKKQ